MVGAYSEIVDQCGIQPEDAQLVCPDHDVAGLFSYPDVSTITTALRRSYGFPDDIGIHSEVVMAIDDAGMHELLSAHDGLSEAESARLDAMIIMLLADQLDGPDTLSVAIAAVRLALRGESVSV